MTLIGKVLVFLNLVFSLLMLAWAWVLYSNRVDWSSAAPKGDQPGGELAARKAELQQLQTDLGPAESGWREARARLATAEGRLVPDRLWYLDELEYLRTGATPERPARAVVFRANLPEPDPANPYRPRMAPATDRSGRPLRSLAAG